MQRRSARSRSSSKKQNLNEEQEEEQIEITPRVATKSSKNPARRNIVDEDEEMFADILTQIENLPANVRDRISSSLNNNDNEEQSVEIDVTRASAKRATAPIKRVTPVKRAVPPSKAAPIKIVNVPLPRPEVVIDEDRVFMTKRQPKLPPIYNGISDLEDWFIQYEAVAVHNNWDELEMIDQLVFAVSDVALAFLRSKKLSDLRVMGWDVIKELFIQRFAPLSSKVSLRGELRRLNQNKGESLNLFIGRLQHICNRIGNVTEDEQKSHFLEGLLPEFQKSLMLFSNLSWEELIQKAIQLDSLKIKEASPKKEVPVLNSMASTSSVTFTPASSSVPALAVDFNNRNIGRTLTGEIICRKCGGIGHYMRGCAKVDSDNLNFKHKKFYNQQNKFKRNYRNKPYVRNWNSKANSSDHKESTDSKSMKQEN